MNQPSDMSIGVLHLTAIQEPRVFEHLCRNITVIFLNYLFQGVPFDIREAAATPRLKAGGGL